MKKFKDTKSNELIMNDIDNIYFNTSGDTENSTEKILEKYYQSNKFQMLPLLNVLYTSFVSNFLITLRIAEVKQEENMGFL